MFTGRQAIRWHTRPRKTGELRDMGLLKGDFYRFFGFGFIAGALLVLGTMGIGGAEEISGNVVPHAHAATAAE
jgi:hypothetical protein